jgi:hypothetical protein
MTPSGPQCWPTDKERGERSHGEASLPTGKRVDGRLQGTSAGIAPEDIWIYISRDPDG